MSRSGINVVRNELRAFDRLAKSASSGDWIIKVDSDVLVTRRSDAFAFVAQSKSSLVGNPCRNYIQGGVYFLRSGDVRRLFWHPLTSNRICAESPQHCPEDAAITEQMRLGHGKIETASLVGAGLSVADFQMAASNFSFLHFSLGAKRFMTEVYDNL